LALAGKTGGHASRFGLSGGFGADALAFNKRNHAPRLLRRTEGNMR
jgi:hypothetical protein